VLPDWLVLVVPDCPVVPVWLPVVFCAAAMLLRHKKKAIPKVIPAYFLKLLPSLIRDQSYLSQI
jgi:hypothetical protein